MIKLIDFKGEHSPLKVSYQLKGRLILEFEVPKILEVTSLYKLHERRHELWQGTCFECFILYSNDEYNEWNFDLEGNWQSYHFTGYRSPHPPIESSLTPYSYNLRPGNLRVELPVHSNILRINPTVILEGNLFFAQSHPKTGPDFHNRESFIIL